MHVAAGDACGSLLAANTASYGGSAMKRTVVVCTLVLSCSVLFAAQAQKKGKPCKKCKDEAKLLVEKMKSANITLKSAIEAGESRCKGDAVLAEVSWSDDGQQPFFAIYCAGKEGSLHVVEVTHEGKPTGMDPATDLPSIHDEETHKPEPPKPGA
jgi:hypothetical protein